MFLEMCRGGLAQSIDDSALVSKLFGSHGKKAKPMHDTPRKHLENWKKN
jgi:hypothetical protein